MHVFFGRINVNQAPKDQFQNAYFHALKGTSYFGDLNHFENFDKEPVYVFMIASNNIELWKADHWGPNGQDLFFTKTGIDLDDMNRAWIAAFKYFYLDADLIVFTTRRPFKKAFFKLRFDTEFTEDMILNPLTYSNYDNYRTIELHNTKPVVNSGNLIFYREKNEWHFQAPDFFDNSLSERFIDNTVNIGNGRPNKDNTLRFISNANPLPAKYKSDELTLLNIYDVFFCDYDGTIEQEITLKPNEFFFKISMSPKDINEDSFNYFIENNLVVVHRNTAGKGTSYESQGEIFNNRIKIGDYFYLCRGNQKFVMIGKIVSDAQVCELEDLGEDGWMQRKIELIRPASIDDKYEGENKWWTPNNNSTCIQIADTELSLGNTLIFAPYFNVSVKKTISSPFSAATVSENKANKHTTMNSILYGPPGTGKTFHSISHSVAIVENKSIESILAEERELVKNRFDQYVIDGQIVFCTFHQSLSYEDFIEGIKPIEPSSEEEELTYAVEDGIFKRLCTEAAFSFIQKNTTTETEKVLDFSTEYDRFVDTVNERFSKGERTELETRSGGNVYIESISQKNNIWVRHIDGNRKYTVSKKRLSKISQAFPELSEVTNINDQFRAEIGGSNSSAYWAVLNAIRKQPAAAISKDTKTISEKEYSYEDKKEIIESLINDDYKIENPKKFVLIIDEINRGNVSQIFGELITLIEDDKRLGKEEALKATLPYAKDSFGVPCNISIIGTMNTADRSVEALDTALRRRFSFVPMAPNPDELKITDDDINLPEILRVLNNRLSVLKDNDHTIGHAWLWNVSDLDGLKIIFRDRILPLLQEYFYNDYEKLGLVLGDAFFKPHVQINSNLFAAFTGGNGLAGQYDQAWQYQLKSANELSIADFKSLEQSNNQSAPDAE
jgi:AAA domain (dynein-related subfamily)